MRVTLVDERDSSWESLAPRYRMYVYEGAGNAVTTLDFEGARYADVVSAGAIADRDGRLWSAAMVIDDSQGRGLVWITGLDYNDRPVTSAEWAARREMQDRYLSARSLAGAPVVLPDGRRLIRMFPDHGHRWPLWESFTDAYAIDPDDLALSDSLTGALRLWYDRWAAVALDVGMDAAWKEEGHRLCVLLQAELGDTAEVRPEFDG